MRAVRNVYIRTACETDTDFVLDPLKYRMLVGMVDCIFADVAQPDQARIVGLNGKHNQHHSMLILC